MSVERHGGLRATIAREAARLMYEESVKQYFTAKRMAAKRVLGRVGGRRLRYRPSDLPSNGEIRDALLAIAKLAEGDGRQRRLFAMRVVALEAMRALEPFSPRLIGSVASGHIRLGSDIDLHVFTDDVDALLRHVKALRWAVDTAYVTILKFGEIREYLHIHVVDAYPIELTVYATRELRFRPRSSTDGKPIERIKPLALAALIASEHPAEWARYENDGFIAGLPDECADDVDSTERAASNDAAAGPFDSLLGVPMDPETLPRPDEIEDPDEIYDALPGFEDA